MSLIAGQLVDLCGTRAAIAALCVTVAVALLGASAAAAYGWLLAAVAVAGIGQALANPATNVLVAQTVPTHRRGTAIGLKQAGVQLAAFGGGLVLPALATTVGWRTTIRLAAVVPLLVLLVAWWWTSPPTPQATGRRWWRLARPSGWLARLVGFSLLLGTGLAAVNTYLPLYATQRLGLVAGTAGALLAVFGVTGLVARVWWGRWADRMPELSGALSLLTAAAVAGVLLVFLAGPLWSGLVWVGALVVGGSATAANAVSMLAVLRRGEAVAQASGLVSLGFFSGFVVGPVAIGWGADVAGWGVAWLAVGAAFAGAAVVARQVRTAGTAP